MPAISLQRATPSPQPPESQQVSESDTEEIQLQSGIRTPARSSTLETVQEISLPGSPQVSTDVAMEKVTEKLASELASHYEGSREARTLRAPPPVSTAESGSESGSVKTESRRTAGTVAPPPLMSRQSSTMSVKPGKGKASTEGSTQNMTVETETVAAVPSVSVAPPTVQGSSTNTLKAKPSTETIRPKKDKKKSTRKQPAVGTGTGENRLFLSPIYPASHLYLAKKRSISSPAQVAQVSPITSHWQGPQDGTSSPSALVFHLSPTLSLPPMSIMLTKQRPASSKAEIFEAKVATAVDENDDSDSEETFVYDSNPPDGPRRFHSRTPSATSMMSQADRTAMRSIHSVMEAAGPSVSIKKHTKFANTASTTGGGDSTAGEEDGRGTARSNATSSRGARNHHHIGRWPRNGGHPSLFDSDSPFPIAQRHKLSANSRNSSGPPSPRNGSSRATNGKRPPMAMTHGYDLDETAGADDERTPLIAPSVRSTRTARSRRAPLSQRQLEAQSFRSGSSYLNRFAACLVVTMMLLVFITGAIGFMFATSQPLTNIELTQIRSVIASEPELMFDMTVRAHNPNIVVVTIDDANLEIFAKSIHAGSDQEWRENPHGPPNEAQPDRPVEGPGPVRLSGAADTPDDDAAPNMRLGTITAFDSPLTFEGSFFHKGMSSSTGSLRLALPGNQTAGGTERWGRIIQDEFDLIVKGIVKYYLPLSQKVRTASITGRATVKPNSANDPSLRPNTTVIRTVFAK
jgi:hypothetical protein